MTRKEMEKNEKMWYAVRTGDDTLAEGPECFALFIGRDKTGRLFRTAGASRRYMYLSWMLKQAFGEGGSGLDHPEDDMPEISVYGINENGSEELLDHYEQGQPYYGGLFFVNDPDREHSFRFINRGIPNTAIPVLLAEYACHHEPTREDPRDEYAERSLYLEQLSTLFPNRERLFREKMELLQKIWR